MSSTAPASLDDATDERRPRAARASKSPELDRKLVDRCLAGDSDAWRDLYELCHRNMVAALKRFRGARSADDLAEEIAARVWAAAVEENGRLLDRFDPSRGCLLTTYMSALALNEARSHFRSESRRARRETRFGEIRRDPVENPDELPLGQRIREFLDRLTPRERQFCEAHLLDRAGENPDMTISRANVWQLRSRVRRKLEAYIRTDEKPRDH